MFTGYLNIPRLGNTNNFHLVGDLVLGRNVCDVHCVQAILVPTSPGPFMAVLFAKLPENMLQNSVYVNFLLTGLVAQLACHPQPLLRSFLLNTNMVFQPSVKVPAAGVRCMRAWVRPGSTVGQARPGVAWGCWGAGLVGLERTVSVCSHPEMSASCAS